MKTMRPVQFGRRCRIGVETAATLRVKEDVPELQLRYHESMNWSAVGVEHLRIIQQAISMLGRLLPT